MTPPIAETITDLFARVPFRPPVALLVVITRAAVAMPAAGRAVPAYGRIAGVVHLVTPGGPALRSGAYPSRHVNRKTPDAAEIANVVVFVKDAPVEPGLPVSRSSIAQRDEAFVPRVTARRLSSSPISIRTSITGSRSREAPRSISDDSAKVKNASGRSCMPA